MVKINRQKKSTASARELDCLRLFAGGYKIKQVSRALSIEAGTVRTHMDRLKNKYGANTLYEVVKLACYEGII